mmetsp:Transcript_4045/g.5959  ORF Transcript_4045/g.5959 Transcript_4045/m.5959 type:complete len:94 (-) Transcript_4045:547-828(-)
MNQPIQQSTVEIYSHILIYHIFQICIEFLRSNAKAHYATSSASVSCFPSLVNPSTTKLSFVYTHISAAIFIAFKATSLAGKSVSIRALAAATA